MPPDLVPDDWYQFDMSTDRPSSTGVMPREPRVMDAAYNQKQGLLFVRFVKPKPNGTKCLYTEVPPNVWRNFKRSVHPGAFVDRVLFDYYSKEEQPKWGLADFSRWPTDFTDSGS